MCVVILELGPPLRVFDAGQSKVFDRFRAGFISGLNQTYNLTEYDHEQSGIQLNLTPLGARLLFEMPMEQLTGRVVELSDVWPEARQLADELREMSDWDQRFDRLETALMRRLVKPADRTKMMAWAYARVMNSQGRISANALVQELGYSHKHVIAMFHDQIGISPKQLARLVRFEALCRVIRNRPCATWAEYSTALGFSDQAHLVREVRAFSGLTPTALRVHLLGPNLSLDT